MKKKLFSLWLFCLPCLCLIAQQTQLSNLPTFYINTENGAPVVSKEDYLSGTLTIVSSIESERLDNVVTEIRGRGNSTWSMPKKAYRIKLDSKTNLLGLPAKEKSWVLLANYADKTLMRNAVAFEMGRFLGLSYTPPVRFVDVVLNGKYIGNYTLTDQVEVAKGRVAIETQKTSDTDLPNLSGGYFLELDGFASAEPVWFQTAKGMKVTVKYPKDDEINPQQLSYITNYLREYEKTLFATDFADEKSGYRAITDTTSLINWYIACEFTGNSDSFWSTYIYKKRDDNKLYFGPLWDYDIAFNNDNRLGNATRKLMRDAAHNPKTWITRYAEDQWFKKAVDRRWKELIDKGIVAHLLEYIDQSYALLNESQKLNFTEWNILNKQVYTEVKLFPTYKGGVDYLKTYIMDRSKFLSSSFETVDAPTPSQPFVAENYYYMLMNKHTNNAIDILDASTETNAPVVMWNPVEGKKSQEWRITATATDTYHLINSHSEKAVQSAGGPVFQAIVDESNALQTWKIIPVGTGNIYGIINASTGDALDNTAGSFENGTSVIVYTNEITKNENQQWYIQKLDAIPNALKAVKEKNGQLTIYPNPATDEATLVVNLEEAADLTITLYTINGQVAYKETRSGLSPTLVAIPLLLREKGLGSGMYYVEVSSTSERIGTYKLMIK